jgi:RND family efflux transporter MFP subunit
MTRGTNSAEDQLRAEIEDLKRQLADDRPVARRRGPSAGTLIFLAIATIGVIAVAFVAGYLPRQRREQVLAAETRDTGLSLPIVNFTNVTRTSGKSELVLPGNIQAVTEAPILARATGYIHKRYVDIGDRVKTGQVVAEIEAPELDQQILQAGAAIEQARSNVQQAEAALQQGRTNEELARVTAERYDVLTKQGISARQENDVRQAQYNSAKSATLALQKAVAVAVGAVAAAEANLARFNQIKTYQTVRAPFDGVITVRNVDTGALVNEGNTMLFRVAQTGTLRTYLNLPQSDAESVRAGQHATLTIPELPGRKFNGIVSRTANALDPATRTLLTEVQVPNQAGVLMPGMYAQVDLSVPRRDPPLAIPGDTLIIRGDGPQVAILTGDDTVHFARIQLGRDFGDHIEVLSGISEGDRLIINPSDAVREGIKVKPVAGVPRTKQ